MGWEEALFGFIGGFIISLLDPAFATLTYIVLFNFDKETTTEVFSIGYLIGVMIGIIAKRIYLADIENKEGD